MRVSGPPVTRIECGTSDGTTSVSPAWSATQLVPDAHLDGAREHDRDDLARRDRRRRELLGPAAAEQHGRGGRLRSHAHLSAVLAPHDRRVRGADDLRLTAPPAPGRPNRLAPCRSSSFTIRVSVSRLGLASPRSILLTCAGDSSHWRAKARSEMPRDSRRRRMIAPTVLARSSSRAAPPSLAAVVLSVRPALAARRTEVGSSARSAVGAGLTQSRAVATSSCGLAPDDVGDERCASASLSAFTLTSSASPTSTGR